MSAWRRVALERFPERGAAIRAAYSVYDLLGQLEHDLRAVYRGERDEPDLRGRVFDYAAWCFSARQNWDLRNAAAVGFYEHLPNTPAGRRDVAARLSFDALSQLHVLFYHMLERADYDVLMAEIARVHGRTLPPLPAAAT